MKTYIAFLRAVNVGGTGKLPMSDLKKLCEDIGCENVKTYIASGNVVFRSEAGIKDIQRNLESALEDYAGKAVGVMVRLPTDLKKVLGNNPFPGAKPNHTVAFFLDKKPPKSFLDTVSGQVDEEIVVSSREVYIHYGSGMASSKLKFPEQKIGTARNMNTIRKMVELAEDLLG